MRTMNRTLIVTLFCLVCLSLTAQKREQPERVSTNHSLGAHVLVGYDNMLKLDHRLQNIGGPMGGVGLDYQLQYGTYSRGAFLFNLGLEAQYGMNFRNADFNITRRVTVPTEEMFLGYHFYNLQERQSAMDVSASLMVGGKFRGFFFLTGARLGYPILADYAVRSDVDRVIFDAQAIDIYTNMPNHLLSSDHIQQQGLLSKRLNPLVALEVGYDFHRPVQPSAGTDKDNQPRRWSFREYGHCQLSAFVNVGVMDYRPDGSALPFATFDNSEQIASVASTSNAREFAAARTIPIYAGLKLAILFEMPAKQPTASAKQQKPYLVTLVRDELTDQPLANATVTSQLVIRGKKKKKKPVVKTTDATYGQVVRACAPGEYKISATHDGYFPQEPIIFTHQDQNDTLRIALYPQSTLRSQVLDAMTEQPVSAQLTIRNEADSIIATTALDSIEQIFALLIDDRQSFTVCASAEGYRDTCLVVTDAHALQTLRLEPVRVKRFILKNMFFATDKTKILPSSKAALQLLYDLLNDHPEIRIRIVGHTDNVGTAAYNQRLSEGRAASVKREMVKRGIDAARIETVGRGEKSPIVPNDTEEHRQMNRRVEIEIIEGGAVELR